MGLKRGERNWEDMEGEYELHLPPPDVFEQLKDNKRRINGILMVCGHEFIISTDGHLEPVDR